MPIQYVSGDLFANAYQVQAFAHGCNCQGVMGKGIAKQFRQVYPEMYAEYRRMCKAEPRQFNPGDSFLWKEAEKPWVFNLATQDTYGKVAATYEAVEQALANMRNQAEREKITSIAMPKIGAGYGKLEWPKVAELIEGAFQGWEGNLFIYSDYVKTASDMV